MAWRWPWQWPFARVGGQDQAPPAQQPPSTAAQHSRPTQPPNTAAQHSHRATPCRTYARPPSTGGGGARAAAPRLGRGRSGARRCQACHTCVAAPCPAMARAGAPCVGHPVAVAAVHAEFIGPAVLDAGHELRCLGLGRLQVELDALAAVFIRGRHGDACQNAAHDGLQVCLVGRLQVRCPREAVPSWQSKPRAGSAYSTDVQRRRNHDMYLQRPTELLALMARAESLWRRRKKERER